MNDAPKLPLILGHRGASYDAPENTLTAFQLALDQGADGIEGDFRLTRDGHIVCIHDTTTRRTAGIDLRVAEATLSELQRLDVGRWKGSRFTGERIPTLADVLQVLPPEKYLFLEAKCGAEIVPALDRALWEVPFPLSRLVLISFHEEVLAAARRELPDLKTCLVVGYRRNAQGKWMPDAATVLKHVRDCGANGLDTEANLEVVDASFCRTFLDAGLELHSWTIDTLDQALPLCRLGVQSLTTNRPGPLRDDLSAALSD